MKEGEDNDYCIEIEPIIKDLYQDKVHDISKFISNQLLRKDSRLCVGSVLVFDVLEGSSDELCIVERREAGEAQKKKKVKSEKEAESTNQSANLANVIKHKYKNTPKSGIKIKGWPKRRRAPLL